MGLIWQFFVPYLCLYGHKTVASGAVHMLSLPRRRRRLDQPNARSSHQLPTPRGGGVAFVLVGGVGVALLGSWLALLSLPVALVCFLDDRHNFPAALSYGVQLATALLLLLISPLPIFLSV